MNIAIVSKDQGFFDLFSVILSKLDIEYDVEISFTGVLNKKNDIVIIDHKLNGTAEEIERLNNKSKILKITNQTSLSKIIKEIEEITLYINTEIEYDSFEKLECITNKICNKLYLLCSV